MLTKTLSVNHPLTC